MKKILFFLIIFKIGAQPLCNLKGKVTEKSTGLPIPGVLVTLPQLSLNAVTDDKGHYSIKNIPAGRHQVKFFITSYQPVNIPGFPVNSGKDNILDMELEEMIREFSEVVVTSGSDSSVMAQRLENPGVKMFLVDETERYTGSRQDPARMVQNFAGVQSNNDARNDIVVRGNSPAGLLWRWEDVDIFNPNHFAIAGTSGGPQSIINNRYLANSEFFTAAFPSSYGNALGAVFDLKMRNGNTEKHEGSAQLGILGTEAFLEGPINKSKGSSYLLSYRYSTMKIFSSINFNLGTSAVPDYQDAGFKIHLPTQNAGVFSIAGIGGISNINIILSKIHQRPRELYGDQNRDQYFGSKTAALTLGHWKSLGSRTTLKSGIAWGAQNINSNHYQIIRRPNFVPKDTLPLIQSYRFLETKITAYSYIRHKFNAQQNCKAGIYVNQFNLSYRDKVKQNALTDTIPTKIENKPFKERMNYAGNFYLVQLYYQQHSRWSKKFTSQAGLHLVWNQQSNEIIPEPRANLLYHPNNKHLISLSGGLHSQFQPLYVLYAIPDSIITNGVQVPNVNKELSNRNLKMSRSAHAVLGHEWLISQKLSIKTELYYQWLWNIPVYPTPSGISLINRGATFTRFFPLKTMVNSGNGYNYGIELTLDKKFSNHYYILSNISLFDSKYLASDNRWHNTDYNARYFINFLTGYEKPFGKTKQHRWNVGTRYVRGGGKLYSPVNLAASNAIMDVVPKNDSINTLSFPDYSRLDIRAGVRLNAKKVSWEIMLDILNILNTRNILALVYAPDPANLNANPLQENYQLGRLPLIYFRLDF
ncbi:MAG: TonB-dependent receptor [Bacteroidia bacterium]|nr:TonB-dependent receptor [Bacteroidia bacterium]